MHIAVRRDARRLAGGARSVRAEQMVPVSTWWHRLREVIDWHHHSEDEVPWPELRREIPGFAEAARTLGDDHGQLDDAMDRVDEAFVHGAPAVLIPAADAFGTILRHRLADQEQLAFHAFAELGPQACLSVERRLLRTAPPKVLTHLPPWMLDEADLTTAGRLEATMPPPVRLLGRTVLRRCYERTPAPVVRLARAAQVSDDKETQR